VLVGRLTYRRLPSLALEAVNSCLLSGDLIFGNRNEYALSGMGGYERPERYGAETGARVC